MSAWPGPRPAPGAGQDNHQHHEHHAHGPVLREDHDHHAHGHDHEDHGRPGRRGWRAGVHWLEHVVRPHGHAAHEQVDAELTSSREGIRALTLSLVALGVTALLQAAVVVVSGSVALLGDTVHNAADALTAVPLGIAFTLGRRAATRRYTYGYGRAEDLAGVAVVAVIAASSVFTAVEAIRRLAHPQDVGYLGAVAAAGLIGFVGNELVAGYRIAVGRRIGSAALVADGLHARTDGFTSLAVVAGAAGVALGWRLADPIVGLLITIAIAGVLRGAAREVYARLMDAVDPELVQRIESTLAEVPGVLSVGLVRVRWIGHDLEAEADIVLNDAASLAEAHGVTVCAEQALTSRVPRLRTAIIHPEPASNAGRRQHLMEDGIANSAIHAG